MAKTGEAIDKNIVIVYNDLFITYGDSILVIKSRTVLGSYETYKEALDATLETE